MKYDLLAFGLMALAGAVQAYGDDIECHIKHGPDTRKHNSGSDPEFTIET